MKFLRTPYSYKTAALLSIITACLIFLVGVVIQYNTVTRYSGILPCADCTGIKTILSIKGDHTYQLKSFYINKGTPFTENGTWQQVKKDTNKTYYQLKSGLLITYYQILNDQTLQMVDGNGNPIRTPINTKLIRE